MLEDGVDGDCAGMKIPWLFDATNKLVALAYLLHPVPGQVTVEVKAKTKAAIAREQKKTKDNKKIDGKISKAEAKLVKASVKKRAAAAEELQQLKNNQIDQQKDDDLENNVLATEPTTTDTIHVSKP
jgi:hypothetical protein